MQLHICENINFPLTEGIVFTDGRSINTNHRKLETLTDSSLDEKPKDDSSASDVKTESTPASTKIISSTCHDTQKVHNLVVAMGAELTCSPLQTNKHDLESSVMNKDSVETQILDGNAVSSDAHHSDIPICSIPMEEGLESRSVVEDHKTRGIANEDARLIEDAVVDDQSTLNTCDLQKVVTKDASCSEAEVDSIKKNYNESRISKEKESLNVDTEISFSQSEASTFAMEEGNNDSRMGGLSSFGMSHVTTSTKPCISGEAIHVCKNNEPDRQGENEIIFQDVSVNGQDSRKFPFDSSQVQSDVDQSHHIDKGFGSSFQSTRNVEPEVAVSTVPADVMPENNSSLHIRSENISSKTLGLDIPPIPSTVESTHEVTDHVEIRSMNVIESASDVNEDCQTKAAEEAGISTAIGSLEQEVVPCPVTGTESHILSNVSKQHFGEAVNSHLPNLGTTAAEIFCEPQAKLSDSINKDGTKEVSMTLVPCDSAETRGNEVPFSFIKDDKEFTQENHKKPLSKISGDVSANKDFISSDPLLDNHAKLRETGGFSAYTITNACGPSTTLGSLPETEKNGSQAKVSANLNPPVSKSIIIRDAKHTLSIVHVPKGNDSSRDERSLTPEVNDLKGNDASKDERSLTPEVMANFPKDDATELAKKGENVSKRKPVSVAVANKTSTISDREVSQNVSKGRSERKRRASKLAGKESSSKVSDTNGKIRARLSEKGDKSTSIPVSPPLGFQLMQSNEVQPYGNIDGTGTKPFALLSASTSRLPDPNTSASPHVLFPQPCTDIQQAQLRAQIFVYGALVQGTAHEEAHMISAFGGPDDGRNLWEKSWRSCMERQHGPKSHPVIVETPTQSQSVKGSSVPPSSSVKSAPHDVPTSGPDLQSVFVGVSPLDTRNATLSHSKPSGPKTKERKKFMVAEYIGQRQSQLHCQHELTPGVSNHPSTTAAIGTPVSSVPITTVENSVISISPPLADNFKSDRNVQKSIRSDESVMKVEEARVHAEEASVLSAAAVNHGLEIWKQLDKQNNSRLVLDIEAKLASASVAVAAAAANAALNAAL
ncbi:hypothetical protein PIB30_049368 [Stylosanthes scabra]|uniref:Uncharacterized protein n=1 Tax=Stylosanthes scabra TaxID=79078 RepID=A0ABU6TJA4_9FABA|nr:hypothetical protein [Stylosanthes scabra]